MEFALNRMRGDEGFLRQLVSQFCGLYANAVSDIGGHIDAGRTQDARRLAHSIKGAAGTLGALALQKAAAALEKEIAEGGSGIARRLGEFGGELDTVLANRAGPGGTVVIAPAAAPGPPADPRELLAKLAGETTAGSYMALDTFAALKAAWPGRATKTMAALEKALANFDGDGAHGLIARLKKKLDGGGA